MYRDLSLPKLLDIKHDHMLAQADDLRGKNEDFNVCRPSTLRHSWYKAVAHHYSDLTTVHLKLHEVRIKELKLNIEQHIDHALMLGEYLVPLQAMLDLVLDDKSSYEFNMTNARNHKCEGKIKDQSRPWSTVVFRPCNKLCYLTESARRKVLDIEA
jgi:hypothetical protein